MTESIKIPERRREILVVSHYFAAHGGGIERVTEKLIREIIANENLHFTWAASDCDQPPMIPGQKMLPMKSINWLEKLCGVPWPVWSFKSLCALHKVIQNADLIWLQDTLYMGNIAAFLMARRSKKPIVITQHIGSVPYRNPLLRGLMTAADKFVTCSMLSRAQQATFISDRVAENYYRRASFTAPVKIIPNGVDLNIFRPAPPEKRQHLRAQFALRADQPVLLFVGRFVEKKGLSAIRQLAAILPDWRFWLAGQGPIDPVKWNLPNVHVFRGRTGAALAELYQMADRLILPSYGEGFPLVIQEAMACGLPVMCSKQTAAGSQLALPHLIATEVDPRASRRTAQAWAEKLLTQRNILPLSKPKIELADVAQIFWQWSKIAVYYGDMFHNLLRQPQ